MTIRWPASTCYLTASDEWNLPRTSNLLNPNSRAERSRRVVHEVNDQPE